MALHKGILCRTQRLKVLSLCTKQQPWCKLLPLCTKVWLA